MLQIKQWCIKRRGFFCKKSLVLFYHNNYRSQLPLEDKYNRKKGVENE